MPLDASTSLLYFEVEDTGVGIASDELEAIFDAFVQAPSAQKSQQGTGLGIPISREFVRMMGGDLTASSPPPGTEGPGSVFKFNVQMKIVTTAEVQTA